MGLALSVLLVWMSAAPAQARTAEECQTEIGDLRAQTDAARTFENPKDKTGLIGKLDSASTKLSRGKTQDALDNLIGFVDKVNALAFQGKLGQPEADTLIVEANDAIACVQGL